MNEAIMLKNATFIDLLTCHAWKNINIKISNRIKLHRNASVEFIKLIKIVNTTNTVNAAGKKWTSFNSEGKCL